MFLRLNAQLWVDAKANKKNTNTPATNVPTNITVNLFVAPAFLNLTNPTAPKEINIISIG